MVATTILMILLPNGSPRYIYPLIVVPCLLLGRALTVDNGSGTPPWIESIWRRFNFLLLTVVSLGVAAMPFFARGDGWILLWTFLEGTLAVGIWFCCQQSSVSLCLACPQQSLSRTSNHQRSHRSACHDGFCDRYHAAH